MLNVQLFSPVMPLSADPSGHFETAEPEAVLFPMFNGDDRIVCRVEWSALRDRAVAEGADPNDIVGTFMKHRATIEQIASEQYDAGNEMPVVWGDPRGSVRGVKRSERQP